METTESNETNPGKNGKTKEKKRWGKTGKTEKNNEQQNHQNWLAIFILAGCYYFDPGVGDLYFGVFLLRCEHYIYREIHTMYIYIYVRW